MKTKKTSAKFLARPTAVLVAACGLASCAVGPEYRRPELAVPVAFKNANENEHAQPVLAVNWWTLFNDPELTRLAEETLAANQNIKAAIARVDEARAATRSARSGFFPAIDVAPSAQRSRVHRSTTNSNANSSAASTSDTANTFTLPLDLSYEVDLWGKVRRQYEYASDSELASRDDLEFVQQTALADLAQAYFTIRLYDQQVKIYQEALKLYQRQLDLTQSKFKAGLALQSDVLQAKIQVDSATNQLIEVQRLRAKQEHAIAVLLGRPPSNFTFAAQDTAPVIPTVPAGVPVDLLNRRPDVAKAEHQLAAANAQIGMAKADFFPSFSLTGSAGFESSSFQHLTDWQNRIWSVGAGLNLPIFQGGKLTAALAQARASYEELVANYRTAVLTAFQDVEDQLSDLHLLAEKAASLDATVGSAREFFRLAELQYRQGLATYLQVIDANQSLLTNELAAAQAQHDRLTATVLLIKAVGGGWSGVGAGDNRRTAETAAPTPPSVASNSSARQVASLAPAAPAKSGAR
jgi:multidrug efflux system outer membrane protein